MRWWFVFVFTAWGLYGEVASLFALDQFYVLVLDINDGRFLVFAKKIVLFFIFYSSERLNWTVVEIDRAQIRIAFISVFQMFFQKQVISRCNVIVFIGLDASFCVFDIKVEILQFLEDGLINWDSVEADDNPAVQRNSLTFPAPFVAVNFLQPIPFGWVYIQNFLQ